MGPYSQALGVPWDVLGDGLQPRAVAIHRGASAGAEGGARRGTQAPRGCPQQQPQLGPDEPRRGPPPGRQRHGALTESLLRARRRQPLTIPVWGGLQVQHRGRAAEETAGLYAAPLRAGWHLAPPSDGACARTEGGRLGRRALGSSPVSRWLRLPPSLQLPTDCCEEENGQAPRAHAPRAHTHTHTHAHIHTLTPARSLPPGSHPSIEKHTSRARLLPALPPHPLPASASQRPLGGLAKAAYSFKGGTSEARAGALGRAAHSPTCQVPTLTSSTHTHTHTHTGCTHLFRGGERGGLILPPGPLPPGHRHPFPEGRNGSPDPTSLAFSVLGERKS